MVTIGEERDHFGFDVIRDKYLDPEEDKKYQEKKRNSNKENNKRKESKNDYY